MAPRTGRAVADRDVAGADAPVAAPQSIPANDRKPLCHGRKPVWVGVDASVRHDSSAIVAVMYKDDVVRLVFHRIFTPSRNDPINFAHSIEATLLDLQKLFSVRKVLFDPYQMVSTAQRLAKAGVNVEEFPQTVPNLTA